MANIVITWNANPLDKEAVFSNEGEMVSPAVAKDAPLKITFDDGEEKILMPGQCFGIAANRKFSVEVHSG